MSYLLRRTLLACALLASAAPAFGRPVIHQQYGYRLDLPIGWQAYDLTDPDHIAFLAPGGAAVLQLITLDGRAASSGGDLADLLAEDLAAELDQDPYLYQGRSASLADISFYTGGFDVRGYMVAIDGNAHDVVLLAFAPLENYEQVHDQLISALNSFALGEESSRSPGPISQYYHRIPPAFDSSPTGSIDSPYGPISIYADAEAIEAAQLTVDREAVILSSYLDGDPEVFAQAWRRYYRQIYRDNYDRLAPVAKQFRRAIEDQSLPAIDLPYELLSWLQTFEYERTGGLSDYAPPLACLATQSGDCDSLAMIYVMLLHHLEVDAILMVSHVYGHAMAGVDTIGSGARFPYDSRQWLVAEFTSSVAMGQIAAEMADPAGWIGVKFNLQPID